MATRPPYGHALTEFHRRWGDEVTSRSSVLLLGDARNNYHASECTWVLGRSAAARPAGCSESSTPNRATTGARVTPSSMSTPPTATTWWSAGHCGSWSTSSAIWHERRRSRWERRARPPGRPTSEPSSGVPDGVRRIFPSRPDATRIVLVRHGEAVCNVNGVVGGARGCTGLTRSAAAGTQVDGRGGPAAPGPARSSADAGRALRIDAAAQAVETAEPPAARAGAGRRHHPRGCAQDRDSARTAPGPRPTRLTWQEGHRPVRRARLRTP